jgi:hypothetical protein
MNIALNWKELREGGMIYNKPSRTTNSPKIKRIERVAKEINRIHLAIKNSIRNKEGSFTFDG